MAFPLIPILSAVASIASSIISSSSQNKTNKEMMRFQGIQQQNQNEFNATEAQKSRDYQSKMSNSEISRRISDLRSAGFNPAFATGVGGASIGSVPQASASSVSVPNLRAPQAPIDPLELSQIALNNASAKKAEAEAESTQKQTDWIDALNQSTIDVNTADISVKGSVVSVNEETKKKIAKDIESAEQGIKNLKKQIELMDSEITKNDIDSFWSSGRYSAEIEQLKSQTHLNDAECKEIFTLLFSKKALLDAQTNETMSRSELNKANTRLANVDTKRHFWLGRMAYWDAGQSRINYELTDKFGEADHWVSYANLGLTHIENIGGLIMDYKRLGVAKRDADTRSASQEEAARHNKETEAIQRERDDINMRVQSKRLNNEQERLRETYRHNDMMEHIHQNRFTRRFRRD